VDLSGYSCVIRVPEFDDAECDEDHDAEHAVKESVKPIFDDMFRALQPNDSKEQAEPLTRRETRKLMKL
jgi:hypothetical protein